MLSCVTWRSVVLSRHGCRNMLRVMSVALSVKLPRQQMFDSVRLPERVSSLCFRFSSNYKGIMCISLDGRVQNAATMR